VLLLRGWEENCVGLAESNGSLSQTLPVMWITPSGTGRGSLVGISSIGWVIKGLAYTNKRA